jgi:hypothetical protein
MEGISTPCEWRFVRGGVQSGAWPLRRRVVIEGACTAPVPALLVCRISLWELLQSQVEVSTLDVATAAGARGVVAAAQGLAPLGGVFHLATVFRDKWLASQARSAAAFLMAYAGMHCLYCMHQMACPACACTAPLHA